MKIQYVRCESENDLRMYPQGFYWYATTDNEDYDGAGTDPFSAVSALADQMERALQPDND